MFDIYDNTDENARTVGWDKVPEHCAGPAWAKYVLHDVKAGKFLFVQEIPHEQPTARQLTAFTL